MRVDGCRLVVGCKTIPLGHESNDRQIPTSFFRRQYQVHSAIHPYGKLLSVSKLVIVFAYSAKSNKLFFFYGSGAFHFLLRHMGTSDRWRVQLPAMGECHWLVSYSIGNRLDSIYRSSQSLDGYRKL